MTPWSPKSVFDDARFAVRSFLRAPAFALAALVTLALCLGANTVIFAVVYGTVLRPSAYPNPSELVWVWSSGEVPLTHHQFAALQPSVGRQITLTAFAGRSFALTGGAEPIEVSGLAVSPNHFGVLGLSPVLGRGFTDADADAGTEPVAVISHEIWQRQFGGDPAVVGRTVELYTAAAIPMVAGAFTGERHTIIGISPPMYRPFGSRTDVLTPLVRQPGEASYSNLGELYLAGRLKPGVSREQARAAIVAAASNLVELAGEKEAIAAEAVISLRDALDGSVRPAMFAILSAVTLVLLIACANVTNLFLVRMHGRERELSVRRAVGATRGRIIRQLMIESLVLASAAAVLGAALAVWSLPVVMALLPPGLAGADIRLGGSTLGFGMVLVLVTALACGVAPALRHQPGHVTGTHTRTGAGGTRQVHAVNRALLVAQVAIAVVLANGAALLLTDFKHLLREDKGFSSERVTTVRIAPAAGAYRETAVRRALYDRILTQVRGFPGVAAAGAIHFLPIAEGGPSVFFRADPGDTETTQDVGYRVITPGYLQTMEIPLRRGRYLTDGDGAASTRVGLVNEALADRLWPEADPLGQTLYRTNGDAWFTVAGVVGNVRQSALGIPPRAEVYLPLAQSDWASAMTLVVRTHGSPGAIGENIRTIVHETDPGLPVTRVATMDAIVRVSVSGPRFYSALFAAFAGLALLLGAVGVYGVIAFVVQMKRDEIGVRMALGATRAAILGHEFRHGAALVAAGLAIGLGGSLLASGGIASLLYGLDPFDPALFALAASGVAAVAGLSIFVPVRRISRVDPMTAIRNE